MGLAFLFCHGHHKLWSQSPQGALPVGSFLEQKLVGTHLAERPGHRCQLHGLRGEISTGSVDTANYIGVQAHNSENILVTLS